MSISGTTQSITSLKINGSELSTLLSALQARQDSITSALSSASDDYNTEIIDARADTFGNSHDNIGTNIRANQLYLWEQLNEKISVLQSQYDNLAAAVIKLADQINNS